jgi:hypothetical protein
MAMAFKGISNSSRGHLTMGIIHTNKKNCSLLFLLIFLSFIHCANASLTTLRDVMDMRSRAAADTNNTVTRFNNLDMIIGTNETLEFCHLIAIMPFSSGIGGVHQPFFAHGDSYEFAAAYALAMQHLNAGDGSIIAEVEGLDKHCPIKFTPELVDSRASASYTVDRMIDIFSRVSDFVFKNITTLEPFSP